MFCNPNLDTIYESISCSKFNLFCTKDCHSKEHHFICKIVCEFLDEIYYKLEVDKCDKDKCISLIDLLIVSICNLENHTNCKKNYGYLLQLDRFICMLKNLKKLLCQLKCICTKDCDLLSKVLCVLFKILTLIQNIISEINNMECLCKSSLCCSYEILDCLLCELVQDIDCLEEAICDLSHLILQIASLNVINCTTCTTSRSCTPKKRDSLCECSNSYYLGCNCYKPKSIKYYNK